MYSRSYLGTTSHSAAGYTYSHFTWIRPIAWTVFKGVVLALESHLEQIFFLFWPYAWTVALIGLCLKNMKHNKPKEREICRNIKKCQPKALNKTKSNENAFQGIKDITMTTRKKVRLLESTSHNTDVVFFFLHCGVCMHASCRKRHHHHCERNRPKKGSEVFTANIPQR